MNLIVNIGNTNTKLGLFQVDVLASHVSVQNEKIDDILQFISTAKVQKTILSATKQVNQTIIDTLLQKGSFVDMNENTKLPFSVEYKSRKSLGDDRLAAVAGASVVEQDEDRLVITAGTCITYNILTKDNVFLGGGISPGVFMRFRAMNAFTGNLPLVENKLFDHLIGRSTEQSIQSGVRKGSVAEMDGIISQYKLLYPKIKVFICGGDASFFESRLKNKIFAHANLELIGMNEILKYN